MGSLKFFDFSNKTFIEQCVLIMHWTHGGFNYQILKNLDLDDFDLVYKESIRIQNQAIPDDTGEGNG